MSVTLPTTYPPCLPVEVDGLVPDPCAVVASPRCEHGSSPVICGHCADGTPTRWVQVPPFAVRLLLSAQEAREAAAALLQAAGDFDDAPLAGRVEGRLVVDGLLVGTPTSTAADLDGQAAGHEAAARRLRAGAAHLRSEAVDESDRMASMARTCSPPQV